MTTLKTRTSPAGTAYEDDFYTWTQEQRPRLRAGDLPGLGSENLAGEIESLGRSQFLSLISAPRVVPVHMLQVDDQPGKQTCSSAISIASHRVHALDELDESPGLKARLSEAIEKAYRRARLEVAKETGLPLKRFTEACSYTYQDIMDRPFAIDPES